MLDRTNEEQGGTGINELQWDGLTNMERRLIRLFRRLSDQEQLQVRRLSEALTANPEELATTL